MGRKNSWIPNLTMLETILVAVPLALAVLVLARQFARAEHRFYSGLPDCLGDCAAKPCGANWPRFGPAGSFGPCWSCGRASWVRWILRLRRKNWNYGFLLILLAGAGTAALQFACAAVSATRSVALEVAAIRLGSTVVCLLFLTPWFISKLPQQATSPRSITRSTTDMSQWKMETGISLRQINVAGQTSQPAAANPRPYQRPTTARPNPATTSILPRSFIYLTATICAKLSQ